MKVMSMSNRRRTMTKLEKYSKAYYCAASNAEALRAFVEEKHPNLLSSIEEVCRSIDLMDKHNVVTQYS
jgi:hypothetical protein